MQEKLVKLFTNNVPPSQIQSATNIYAVLFGEEEKVAFIRTTAPYIPFHFLYLFKRNTSCPIKMKECSFPEILCTSQRLVVWIPWCQGQWVVQKELSIEEENIDYCAAGIYHSAGWNKGSSGNRHCFQQKNNQFWIYI